MKDSKGITRIWNLLGGVIIKKTILIGKPDERYEQLEAENEML